MPGLFKRLISKFHYPASNEDKNLLKSIKIITGGRPYNLSLYKLAMVHSSTAKINDQGLRESNERLEYLGDSILGMVVAEFLFAKFPYKDEGFLTEVRSKIVNREALNQVSRKIGLKDLIRFQQHGNSLSPKSIYGDSLEALIGAVYLDRGFPFAKQFVIKKLVVPHYDLDHLIHTVTNYKSKIIEWAQKENKDISFEITEIESEGKQRKFKAQVVIDEKQYEIGYGSSKKKAEQDASRKTLDKIENKINESNS